MKLDPRRLLVHAALKQMIRKEHYDTVAEFVAARQANPAPSAPPKGRASRGVDITVEDIGGVPVYRLRPQRGASARRLVYLHGGAYVGEIGVPQWSFVLDLVRGTGVTCLVPIYVLAPQQTAEQTVQQMASVVTLALSEDDEAVVMGDSAGGGLVVAATQTLLLSGATLPSRLVLLSPWLDVTMVHPDQVEIEQHDMMLRRDYLADAGRLFAGDLGPDDWRASPLNGDLTKLPPLHVFTGTHDILVTDSRQLVERVCAAGGEVDYVEAPQMQHVYAIFPILPESLSAQRSIRALLKPATAV